MARQQVLRKGDPLLTMPDIQPFGYMIEMLQELGVCSPNDGVTWEEIRAWKESTKTPVSQEEMILLRHLSKLYFVSVRRYQDSGESSPVTVLGQDQAALTSKLQGALRLASPQEPLK